MSSEFNPPDVYKSLDEALRHITGKETAIRKRSSLSGGDINRAYKLELEDKTVLFIKENSRGNLPFFTTEYRALLEMKRVGGVSVPEPLACGTDGENAFLILPYLDCSSAAKSSYWSALGRDLARFHLAAREKRFGFYEDNYIGASPQPNGWLDDWVEFFRVRRLEYQMNKASPHIDGDMSRVLLRLLDRLDRYLPQPQAPALLHGDLWSGNILTGPDGNPWLIDPAAYYGHPEADLAMTQLFGAPPEEFFRSYHEIYPIDKDYGERKDLYNLYHLLNHYNLFGPSYLSSLKSVIRKFA